MMQDSALVCFCFGHTAAAVRAARREDGSNEIVEAVTEACRQGLGRCAERNPSGRCCLGQLRAIAGEAPRACCE
ncbi:MAG: hypothetical protein KC457_22585 [Myxococcales bacterium]|nr:hypothetical protein [Myxococcales bacterium]